MNNSVNHDTKIAIRNKNETLLAYFEAISDNSYFFGRGEFDGVLEEDAKVVANFLGINIVQSIFFCVILDLSLKSGTAEFVHISDRVEMSPLRLSTYMNEIDSLEQKGLVRKHLSSHREKLGFGNSEWSVGNDIFYAIRTGDSSKLKIKPDKEDSIGILEKIITSLDNFEIFYLDKLDMSNEVKLWLNQYSKSKFSISCKKHSLKIDDILLMAVALDLTLGGVEQIDLYNASGKIFSNYSDPLYFRQDIVNGKNKLEKLGFVKLEDGHFKSEKYLVVTEKGINEFLEPEISHMGFPKKENTQLIYPKDIIQKPLFFNEKEIVSLDFLTNILKEDNYKKLKRRLEKEKMPTGIITIFMGPSGVGKSSFVKEIAIRTSRPLFEVDVSKVKDQFHGNSEKNLRKLFKDYNNAIKISDITPIMWMDEMDSVVSRRVDVTQSIDKTSNSLINILLQEMDETKGIIIGTSNLVKNIDSAIDRRCLFKIKFNQPSAEVQKLIWDSKVGGLSEKDKDYLVSKYNFSGGSIENCARKVVFKNIISNEKPTLKMVEEFCQQEKFEGNQSSKIGFN